MSSWLSPVDLPNIVYKKKFSGIVQRGQKSYKVSFESGQRIFVLPSPDDLPAGLDVRDVDKIPREYRLCAEIVSCCGLKTGKYTVGFLKVIVNVAFHAP